MAIAAPTIWRIGPSGSIQNGGGYDVVTYPGGTDYTQQDAAQLSLTDLASAQNSLTVTSVTGGFTAAMVGNFMNIRSGTNFVVGFYPIATYVDTNTVTVDRFPATAGAGSAGAGKVGGRWGDSSTNPFTLCDPSRATGNKMVPGNVCYVRGAGSDTPSAADYTTTSPVNSVLGNNTAGNIQFVGENGRPRLTVNQRILFSPAYLTVRNFYIITTANSNCGAGLIASAANSVFDNVIINTSNLAACVGIAAMNGTVLINCEIWSGTTSPTANSGSAGILTGGANGGPRIIACKVHHMGDIGIDVINAAGCVIQNCQIYANKGIGIRCAEAGAATPETVCNNIVDGNSGDGINLTVVNAVAQGVYTGNLITNNNQSGKIGFNVAAGTAAVLEALRTFLNFNFFYNNATHRSTNLAAGANDVTLTADPYTSAAGFDYSLNTTAGGGAVVRAVGFPKLIGTYAQSTGGTRSCFPDGGTTQHSDPSVTFPTVDGQWYVYKQ